MGSELEHVSNVNQTGNGQRYKVEIGIGIIVKLE
jgi:hypothetical protein